MDTDRSNFKMRQWGLAGTELIHEIVGTAERIAAARSGDGERIVRTDALWSLLCAIRARSGALGRGFVGEHAPERSRHARDGGDGAHLARHPSSTAAR
jgi:hypothetical protein